MQTLLEIASVFDVALQVRFVPYSSFLQATRDVSIKTMNVPTFEDEVKASMTPLTLKDVREMVLTGDIQTVDLTETVNFPEPQIAGSRTFTYSTVSTSVQ